MVHIVQVDSLDYFCIYLLSKATDNCSIGPQSYSQLYFNGPQKDPWQSIAAALAELSFPKPQAIVGAVMVVGDGWGGDAALIMAAL
ncbi:hypothetical protein Tco_1362303 [Tanacetum coccineum]